MLGRRDHVQTYTVAAPVRRTLKAPHEEALKYHIIHSNIKSVPEQALIAHLPGTLSGIKILP
jgi:hypothetical protein